ncbi:M56 family metallopeptidase [Kineococcus sp. LSe6-4]|uniref:M56 family metallopeptidase n=1 Tax=Kineococcus halophytocola TaxID=3234027 RepID=A0ABV4H1E1_9ACTN
MLHVPDALDVLVPSALAGTVLLRAGAARAAVTACPARAVRLLGTAAAAATLAAATAVVAVVVVLLARLPVVSAWGRWSTAALPEPRVSWVWSVPVALALLATSVALVRHVVLALRQLWAADTLGRALGASRTSPGWVVVEDPRPDAFALPAFPLPRRLRARGSATARAGSTGRVVVSHGMLRALTPDQQRVLLEHERSHLEHRHHLWVQLGELVAVVNPLLSGVPGWVRDAAERQADLDAAERVGDRTLTAQAIAAAALARSRTPPAPARGRPGLHATGGDVARRVEFLLRTGTRGPSGRGSVVVLWAVVGLSLLTGAGTLYSLGDRLQQARVESVTQVSDTTADGGTTAPGPAGR